MIWECSVHVNDGFKKKYSLDICELYPGLFLIFFNFAKQLGQGQFIFIQILFSQFQFFCA